MESLYWDDFERRITETTNCICNNMEIPVRRVACFITNKCNFKCTYCNLELKNKTLDKIKFLEVIRKYGNNAIIHITGGEPSVVKWLYPIIEYNKNVRFHLNTNAYLCPPKNIKRLKVSLDSHKEDYFNALVGRHNAFKHVVENIKIGCDYTTVSITCVLNKENYLDIPDFIDFCNKEFPNLYAIFFSSYKGTNKRFVMSKYDVDYFFSYIKPIMETKLNKESLWLFTETIDEKFRLLKGTRFPENSKNIPCYLSMSEKVIDWNGAEYNCSHLFRDNINHKNNSKHNKCKYGCNRKLVKFNEEVRMRLTIGGTYEKTSN